MHPPPEVHVFPVECMDLENHAPGNAWVFLTFNVHVYRRVHTFVAGCMVLWLPAPDVCIRKILNFGHCIQLGVEILFLCQGKSQALSFWNLGPSSESSGLHTKQKGQ